MPATLRRSGHAVAAASKMFEEKFIWVGGWKNGMKHLKHMKPMVFCRKFGFIWFYYQSSSWTTGFVQKRHGQKPQKPPEKRQACLFFAYIADD